MRKNSLIVCSFHMFIVILNRAGVGRSPNAMQPYPRSRYRRGRSGFLFHFRLIQSDILGNQSIGDGIASILRNAGQRISNAEDRSRRNS
jgi:hypothetical protein